MMSAQRRCETAPHMKLWRRSDEDCDRYAAEGAAQKEHESEK